MSKANMIKNVKEVKEVTVDIDALVNDALTDMDNVLTVAGNAWLLHLDESLELTLKSIEQFNKDLIDTTTNTIKSYNRGFNVKFADADNTVYTMELLGFYLDTKTGKSVNLTDMCRNIMQGIVDATRSKSLNQAVGKKLCVTATEKISSNGRRYTRYTIEAAE